MGPSAVHGLAHWRLSRENSGRSEALGPMLQRLEDLQHSTAGLHSASIHGLKRLLLGITQELKRSYEDLTEEELPGIAGN